MANSTPTPTPHSIKVDLKVNKIDRETFDSLSASQISPQELWFITSADSVVVDIDKIGVSRDWTPEISALSSEIDDVETQIQELDLSAIQQELSATQATLSAMEEIADYFESLSSVADLSAVEELVDGKRDYDDLTYNLTSTSAVVEQFDPTKMDSDQVSAVNAYRSGMQWEVVLDEIPSKTFVLEYRPLFQDWVNPYEEQYDTYSITLSWNDGNFHLGGDEYTDQIGVPPTGATTWTARAEDNDATVTLTMPSTTIVVPEPEDNLVLESQLSAYVPTSQFDLSGLGCTTLNLSGTYEDETTFSYDFVVKEAIQ